MNTLHSLIIHLIRAFLPLSILSQLSRVSALVTLIILVRFQSVASQICDWLLCATMQKAIRNLLPSSGQARAKQLYVIFCVIICFKKTSFRHFLHIVIARDQWPFPHRPPIHIYHRQRLNGEINEVIFPGYSLHCSSIKVSRWICYHLSQLMHISF